MGEPLAIRRQWRLMPVVTPPRGLWRHLVTSPKPTLVDAELELVLRERKRKWEQISYPCASYSSYGSDCVFCIVYNVWPRCGSRLPKKNKDKPEHFSAKLTDAPDGNGTHKGKCIDED